MKESWLSSIVDLVLYGHFWIAAAAAAMSLQTKFLVTGAWSLSRLDGFIAAGTLTIYALHRLVALQMTDTSGSMRFSIMSRYRRHILLYAGGAAVVAAYCFFRLSPEIQLSLLTPSLIALGYVLPLLNGKRLRDYPYVKIFLIALAWAWITVIAPAQSVGRLIDGPLIVMALERACFIFAITIPFDIRDLALDREADVDTLPGAWGVASAKIVATIALIAMMLLVIGNHLLGFYSLLNVSALLLTALVSSYLLQKAHPNRHDYYYTGLLDGTMILQALLVIFLDKIG